MNEDDSDCFLHTTAYQVSVIQAVVVGTTYQFHT